jgi:hypothetical protein
MFAELFRLRRFRGLLAVLAISLLLFDHDEVRAG